MYTRLFALAVTGIATLGLLDIFHGWFEHHWFGFTLPFWHHFAALVAGASTAGILFEVFAREHFLRDLKKGFLNDDDLVRLFAGEEREHWVATLLSAQIKDDPTRTLSGTIFADVVKPFMSRRKFRSRMHYSIGLKEAPSAGWQHDAIHLSSIDYAMMAVDLDMRQYLPPVPAKELNVSIVFGTSVEDLQRAFDDDACIYREHLMLLEDGHDRAHWDSFARSVAGAPERLADLGLSVTMRVNGSPVTRSRVDVDHGRLRIWFPHPGGEELDLVICLTAPYPRQTKYFEVVFGEPVSSARVTFCPGFGVSPSAVTVIDFLQGQRRAGPTCARDANAVDVTFPPADGTGAPRWILPRSGLLFLWQ